MRIIRRNENERRTPARRLSRIFASGVIAFSILNVYVNHLAFQYQFSGDLSIQEEQRQNSFVIKGLRRLVHNHHLLFNQTLLVKQFRYDEVDEEQRVAYNTKMEQTKRRNISNERRPSIVWLMSYPNSGTSFTMSMTFKDSNHTVAVNYPAEPKHFGHSLESLYDSSAVPFLLHPNLTLPTKYILTKTHCTGYCTHCPPHRYFNLTKEFFYEKCASVTDHKDEGHYSDFARSRVEKAVHLFRDPVDNVVSNYHLLLKQFKRKGNNKLLGYFSNDRAGFRKFCEVRIKLAGGFVKHVHKSVVNSMISYCAFCLYLTFIYYILTGTRYEMDP